MAYCLELYGGWETGLINPSTNYFVGGDNYNSARTGVSGASGYANTSVEIPKSGTIRSVYVKVRLVGPTTPEVASHFIRINDTTDVGEIDFPYTTTVIDGNSAPNVAVATGDTISLKIVTPAWSSGPSGARWYCLVYIE